MGADQYTIGLVGSISLVVALVLQIPAGWLVDRIGRKKTYFMFRPVSYITILVLASPQTRIPAPRWAVGRYGNRSLRATMRGNKRCRRCFSCDLVVGINCEGETWETLRN